MIPIRNIYFMLSYAFQVLNEQGYKSIETEQFDNVAELCAAILSRGVSMLLKRGLGREYIEKNESLSAPRGRIEISESIKTRSTLKRQLVCSYDDFSENSYMNRIIKTTMEMLLHADIAKAKITAYSEMTEELEKLPAAPYAQVILDGIQKSVRKKIAKEIMVGAGTANTIVGIFSAKADAIDAATDKELAKIDNTTLDEIVFSYGGDEAVEGQCVLILSKADLKAFSSIRTTDGKPFYDIKIAGNGGSGTINTVPFIINSACGSITDSKTTAGTYCMAYGNLQNYQLTVFSQLDIRRSDDFKFKSGMIAHRGSVFVGGNVVSYNGFLRIKKAATA